MSGRSTNKESVENKPQRLVRAGPNYFSRFCLRPNLALDCHQNFMLVING